MATPEELIMAVACAKMLLKKSGEGGNTYADLGDDGMVTVFVNGQPKYIMHADTFAKLYFEAEDKAQRPIHEGHLYQLPPQRHGTDEDK